MSATLDSNDENSYRELFQLETDKMAKIKISGNGVMFNIKEHYLKSPTPNYEETILNLIQSLYDKKIDKNNFKVLVFLTGPAQIERMASLCKTSVNIKKFYSGEKDLIKTIDWIDKNNQYIIFSTNMLMDENECLNGPRDKCI